MCIPTDGGWLAYVAHRGTIVPFWRTTSCQRQDCYDGREIVAKNVCAVACSFICIGHLLQFRLQTSGNFIQLTAWNSLIISRRRAQNRVHSYQIFWLEKDNRWLYKSFVVQRFLGDGWNHFQSFRASIHPAGVNRRFGELDVAEFL